MDTNPEMKSDRMSIDPRFRDLGYTVRRYFVDEFYCRHVQDIGGRVLDIGGKKTNKRGQFNISSYPNLDVVYVNVEAETNPDICCDASSLPLADDSFDAVICSEVLEHVADPKRLVDEAYRVLRPGGKLLVCVPFLSRVHADPHDYGRYTEYYWREVMKETGFSVTIEQQGYFWSVLADFLKQYLNTLEVHRLIRPVLGRLLECGGRRALKADASAKRKGNSFLTSFTTGFGIVCDK